MIFLILSFLSCHSKLDGTPDTEIADAWLEDFRLNTVGLAIGDASGDAWLHYVTPAGTEGGFSVRMRGPAVGGILAVSFDPEGPSKTVDLDLSEADAPVLLSDVLGTYRGGSYGLDVIAGATSNQMKNAQGVRLREVHFTTGVSFWAGYEWLRITEGGEATPGPDTGGSTDTNDVQTDDTSADTAPDNADTGGDDNSGGCGGKGGDSANDSGSGQVCGGCCGGTSSLALLPVLLWSRRRRRQDETKSPRHRGPIPPHQEDT